MKKITILVFALIFCSISFASEKENKKSRHLEIGVRSGGIQMLNLYGGLDYKNFGFHAEAERSQDASDLSDWNWNWSTARIVGFYRVDIGEFVAYLSLGLGYGIAKYHPGSLQVSNPKYEGTAFSVMGRASLKFYILEFFAQNTSFSSDVITDDALPVNWPDGVNISNKQTIRNFGIGLYIRF